jgi:hypothetical protein
VLRRRLARSALAELGLDELLRVDVHEEESL